MNWKHLIELVAIAGLLQVVATPQTGKSPLSIEQSEFSMEGSKIARPVDIPEGVLQLLRKNKFVSECFQWLRAEDEASDEILGSWFVGSEIHLGSIKEVDLVVQPRDLAGSPSDNRCLWHAHSMPFWVFTKTQAGYAIALEDHTQVLRVLDSKTNGYRDIETSMSATLGLTKAVFKFDGHQYKLYKRTNTPPPE